VSESSKLLRGILSAGDEATFRKQRIVRNYSFRHSCRHKNIWNITTHRRHYRREWLRCQRHSDLGASKPSNSSFRPLLTFGLTHLREECGRRGVTGAPVSDLISAPTPAATPVALMAFKRFLLVVFDLYIPPGSEPVTLLRTGSSRLVEIQTRVPELTGIPRYLERWESSSSEKLKTHVGNRGCCSEINGLIIAGGTLLSMKMIRAQKDERCG